MLKRLIGAFVFASATVLAGGVSVLPTTARAQTTAGSVQDFLRTTIDADASRVEFMDDELALRRFYANRDFRPFWYDQTGPTRAAVAVIAQLADAESWGLKAKDFELSPQARDTGSSRRSPQEVAAIEYELMNAVLRYARQASGGRIVAPDRDLSDFLDRRPELPDSIDVIDKVTSAADPGKALQSFQPQHEQFQRLHAFYAKTKAEAAKIAATRIDPRGPMLVPGTRSDEIARLRARLGVASNGDNTLYDTDLKNAVKAFQRSNGLSSDGLVGRGTRAALSRDASANLDSVVASMEEWRWMPRDLGATHLLVNIPSFTVQLVQNGKTTLTERVIVGKPATPTPIFSKPMTTIVMRPSWFLPDSIKVEKLLSAARRGRSLESEGIVVKKGKRTVSSWKVNWEKANLSAYSIYQPSGDGNALGDVKFLFPNKHSVYLHDTPNKSLFQTSERLYSHGCVRLRNPVSFAQKLFDIEKGEGELDAKRLADSGPGNNEITLDKPIPVHVGYFSVWIDDDGHAEFYGDPYGHDERVTLALDGRWKEIDKGPRHNTEPDSGLLAGARLSGGSDVSDASTARASRPSVRPGKFVPPFGLLVTPTSTSSSGGLFSPPKAAAKSSQPSNPRRHSVGDLMTSAFAR
ncbi:MAG: L,D-transpeptidase family protein [Hyphomicrobiaceae bacterium]